MSISDEEAHHWDEMFEKHIILVAFFRKISQRPLLTSLSHGWSNRFRGILNCNNVLMDVDRLANM